jgi:hypothetical protein
MVSGGRLVLRHQGENMSELLITIGVLFIGAIVGIGAIVALLHFFAD